MRQDALRGTAAIGIRKLIGGVQRVQGVATGSRTKPEELIAAGDAHELKPVIDETAFALDELGAALERQKGRNHIGKIVVDIL